MKIRPHLPVLIISIVAGVTAIGCNTYLLLTRHPGPKFSYFALGAIIIFTGWYISRLLVQIDQLRMKREDFQSISFALEREQGQLEVWEQRLPKISDMEDSNRLPPLTPEQLCIMQQLFRDNYQIHVKFLPGGFSNFGVFRIIQEQKEGDKLDESGSVIKYLDVKDIRDEIRVYEKGGLFDRHPLPFTPGRFTKSWPSGAELANAPETMLGAVCYHFATLEKGNHLQSLSEIYDELTFEEVAPYLQRLFDERLLVWYRHRDHEDAKPFGGPKGEYERLYRNRERIQENISILLSMSHQELNCVDRIHFPFLPQPWSNHAYYNPIYWILNTLVPGKAECFRAECRYSPIHGDLHTGNILIEHGRDTHIWLIDFSRAHVGPALVDFATLEADVKFRLLDEGQCSLEDWLRMEEMLLTPLMQSRRLTLVAPWQGGWKPENEYLYKAWEFIGFLRDRIVSSRLMGIDVRAYYLALLHSTLPVVYRHHTEFQKQCALTSAAWICEYLSC